MPLSGLPKARVSRIITYTDEEPREHPRQPGRGRFEIRRLNGREDESKGREPAIRKDESQLESAPLVEGLPHSETSIPAFRKIPFASDDRERSLVDGR